MSVDGRASLDEAQRPPVPRRLSVSFPAVDPEHPPRGTHEGVGTHGGALLREAYHGFLARAQRTAAFGGVALGLTDAPHESDWRWHARCAVQTAP